MSDSYGGKAGLRIPDVYPGTQQWDTIAVVAGSDATTTGQALVDITGLALGVVHASTYEIEAVLQTLASADVNGVQVGINVTQTPVTVQATVTGNTTTTTIAEIGLQANNTAAATVFNTTSAGKGLIIIKGFVVTHATLDGTLSIQHLKPTSGTSTIKVGSSLKLRKVA